MRLLVKNIGTIVGIETAGRLRLCGGEMDRLETFDDAWLLADDGRIAAFGSMDSLGEMAADEVADADLGKQDVQDAAVAGAEEEGEDHDRRDGGNDVGVVGSHPEEAPEMADLSDERRNDDRHAKTDEQ